MATRTQNRSSNRSKRSPTAKRGASKPSERTETSREDSAFSWGKNGGGALFGAALAGAAIGFAANFGRKFLM